MRSNVKYIFIKSIVNQITESIKYFALPRSVYLKIFLKIKLTKEKR